MNPITWQFYWFHCVTHSSGKIGVVAAHGNSTASSMVQVVKQLLEVDQVTAVDMPLDMPPAVALKNRDSVRAVNDGSGVILLVDMGSLATFNNEIQRETAGCSNSRYGDTSIVLETVRKASVIGTDLDQLYDSLRKFRGYGAVTVEEPVTQNHHPKAILAVCASGKGTAQRIKELIQSSLSKRQNQNVEVVTLSVADLRTDLDQIQQRYRLIAATGIIDPHIDHRLFH